MSDSERVSESAVRAAYTERYNEALQPVEEPLRQFLVEHTKGLTRIDRISVRAKSIERFVAKAISVGEAGQRYDEPLDQIQDQLGARIVTFYLDDVEAVSNEVLKYFKAIEAKEHVPKEHDRFGYFGLHYILLIPSDVVVAGVSDELLPPFFELQIKTLYQHAWAESNHDLAYKPSRPLTNDQHRKVAFTAAQSWGADSIFNELHRELKVVG